jgi:hypothetical protein
MVKTTSIMIHLCYHFLLLLHFVVVDTMDSGVFENNFVVDTLLIERLFPNFIEAPEIQHTIVFLATITRSRSIYVRLQ